MAIVCGKILLQRCERKRGTYSKATTIWEKTEREGGSEKEREGGRERGREKEREGEREGGRKRGRERGREGEREGEREGGRRGGGRKGEREGGREGEREGGREGEREGGRKGEREGGREREGNEEIDERRREEKLFTRRQDYVHTCNVACLHVQEIYNINMTRTTGAAGTVRVILNGSVVGLSPSQGSSGKGCPQYYVCVRFALGYLSNLTHGML